MQDFPRDEFDEIDEATARRGVHRAAPQENGTSNRSLVLMLALGLVSLLVGGVMFVLSPRTAGPAAQLATSSASAEASESASASASPSPSVDVSAVRVEVYNGGAPGGAAAQAAQVLEAAGYSVAQTANWQGTPVEESAAYYATGSSDQGRHIADLLGLPYFVQDYEATAGSVYVVLGPDFDPTALGTETASQPDQEAQVGAEASASASASAGSLTGSEPTESATATLPPLSPSALPSASTSADPLASPSAQASIRYSYSPAIGYYQDPEGAYIYDATSGTYQLAP